jgi:heat-inducible transcriptional repressor
LKISHKKAREEAVLLALLKLYIKTARPVGSQSLKEELLHDVSSATIRNYFVSLEKKGFLQQSHTSGGRIPTTAAYRYYFHYCLKHPYTKTIQFPEELDKERKDLFTFLQKTAELLSEASQCATFVSSPHFLQDFVQQIKLFPLDKQRALCAVVTDFGFVHTETIHLPFLLTPTDYSTIEHILLWRLHQRKKPLIKKKPILKFAEHLYHEVIMRHITTTTSSSTKMYRTGLSQFLHYPECRHPNMLVNMLSLFDQIEKMQTITQHVLQKATLVCWIGEELNQIVPSAQKSTILAIPYYVRHIPVGIFALIGPTRLHYPYLLSLLQAYSKKVSHVVTKSICTFKISYRTHSKEESEKKYLSHHSIFLEKHPTKGE